MGVEMDMYQAFRDAGIEEKHALNITKAIIDAIEYKISMARIGRESRLPMSGTYPTPDRCPLN